MRVICKEYKVFTVDELSDKAKEKAHNKYMETEYFWSDENSHTLEKFCETFNINVKDWSYGNYGYGSNYIKWEFKEDYDEHIDTIRYKITGVRLLKWILNNHYRDLFKPKYYSKWKYLDNGNSYTVSRHSKIVKNNDCVFTGYGMDYDIMQPLLDFLKKPCEHTTLEDLMDRCLDAWLDACQRDYDDYYSMESFEEHAMANEYEFLEDGSRFL